MKICIGGKCFSNSKTFSHIQISALSARYVYPGFEMEGKEQLLCSPSLAGHGFVRRAVLFGDPLLPPKPTTSSSPLPLVMWAEGGTDADGQADGWLAHYGFLVRNIGCGTDGRPVAPLPACCFSGTRFKRFHGSCLGSKKMAICCHKGLLKRKHNSLNILMKA